MQKSIVESCVDRKFSDRLSSFERCQSSLLRLLMALQRSLLRIDKASLLETFLMKLNMKNYILLVLLLLVSMVLLKCTNSPLVIHFLIFVRLIHLSVLLIIILSVSFVIFSHLQCLMVTLAKLLFLLFLKLRMQFFPKIPCFVRCNQSFYSYFTLRNH